ncbi:hypothetical protein QBC40DRAFT_273653 [Triangularia verruculosa]|uniref:Uncharacterized protein n=1 Tax=Triangularia verruculosa TaxID=2587418 RepID=A0AAN6XNH9_9PEZI|nr:hypothetical protein QBC40DRAFT_273653 [Triangularia verruculosa]
MTTTTATVNAHQMPVSLNWEYLDQPPVSLSLQIPQAVQPFWNQNQDKMSSKRLSIPRCPLPARQSSSAPSDTKMRPEKLPPLIIPQRQPSHKALLLQLQIVGVPGAVTLRRTSYQSHQQPPYRNYQHERVYQSSLTPERVEEPSSQRVASIQCPVIRPVPIPIPNPTPVPPIPNNYPPNSSARRRLSQVINRARSRSKSRDRRKANKTVEPETPFLASPPYGTGNTLNPGTPFLNDAPVVVEPETPFLALRLERDVPEFAKKKEEEDFLTVLDKKKSDGGQPPDSAMTMGSFLSKHKYPPILNNQSSFVESPARYHFEFDEEDARIRLPSQSPKKGHRQSWYTSEQQQQQQETQRNKTLKRSSAVYGGKGGRLGRKDTMSPRLAGNGFSAGGGRPVSLPPWSKILPPGPRKSGEMDMAEVYARMDSERSFESQERGRRREWKAKSIEGVKVEEMVARMDSFSSVVSDGTCVAEERKPRAVSQYEPEQELVDEFGEREKAALRELLEYLDSILGPTDTSIVRPGVRCAAGDWSSEQGWWRDVRRSLQ